MSLLFETIFNKDLVAFHKTNINALEHQHNTQLPMPVKVEDKRMVNTWSF